MKTLFEAAREVLDKSQREENFKNWFGKSILKHEDGTPMHFYHGTDADFHTYDYAHVGKGNDSYGAGFYFTNRPDVASMYANIKDKPDSPNVHRVHLRVEKPIYPEDETPFKREHIQKLIMAAPDHEESLGNFGDVGYSGYRRVLNDAVDSYAELGKFHAMNALGNDFYHGHAGKLIDNIKKITKHDAVIVQHPDIDDHIIVNVFHPNQIKSSIGNTGQYSKRKPNITESTLSPYDEVKQFRDKWNEKGVDNFAFAHNDGTISLSQLIVPKSVRNSGIGSTYMKELTEIADKHNHRVVLTPSSDFGGTKSRLVSFYKRHGFVENKGSAKDYTVSEAMYRNPKKTTLKEDAHEEEWLHVQNRKNITPIEHINDIVNEHKKLGWQYNDDERLLSSPLSTGLNGGSYRSLRMKTPDGKTGIINVKFRYPSNKKQTEYRIKRTFMG